MARRPGLKVAASLLTLASLTAAADQPACAARSQRDPGRLDVEARAEHYGVVPPCRATVVLAIARNTPLRRLALAVSLREQGRDLARREVSVDLEGPTAGQWRAETAAPAASGRACRDLDVHVTVRGCAGVDGRDIVCPAIRVQPRAGIGSLKVAGADLDVCYDEPAD